MSDKQEPLRHVDKTRQDHQPVSERQRVKDWRNRIKAMRNTDENPHHEPFQETE